MDGVEALIKRAWGRASPVGVACLNIWKGVLRTPRTDNFSYDQLEQFAKAKDERALAMALVYLTSVDALRLSLMYEHDGDLILLPHNEVKHFTKGESVVHPYTGRPMLGEEVLVAFEPGEKLRSTAR
jgi:hypothetical protein